MEKPSDFKEKRRYPRALTDLSVEFWMEDGLNSNPGLVINLSKAGLLIQTFKDMPVGSRIHIEILGPKNLGLPKLNAIAEIVWKDLYPWEDWEGYQYGLKFIQILNGYGLSLERFLLNRSHFDQVLGFDYGMTEKSKR